MRVVRVGGDNEFGAPEGFRESFEQEPEVAAEAARDYPLVLVNWHDAWFDFDQEGPEDSRPDYLVRTVGFLVSDGPRFVSVAQEILPDGDGFRAVTHIPRSIIESISRLEDGGPMLRPQPAG